MISFTRSLDGASDKYIPRYFRTTRFNFFTASLRTYFYPSFLDDDYFVSRNSCSVCGLSSSTETSLKAAQRHESTGGLLQLIHWWSPPSLDDTETPALQDESAKVLKNEGVYLKCIVLRTPFFY